MSLSKPQGKGNKWKSNYDSSRKFKSEWQKDHPWVKKATDGESAYCSFCRINITPRLSNVKQHEDSSKHQKHISMIKQNRKINACTPDKLKEDDIVKRMELQFAVAITCHSVIMSIDHLGEIIVQHGKGSKLEKMKLHRTKCSILIKDVISPALNEDICKDIIGQKYCVMIDESTDVSCKKYLCVVIRYYSKFDKKISTSFLSLIPVISATGEDLFEAMKCCLEQSGLKLTDCVGFACDGASSMIGQHNSVWSRIREASPNCILMTCICHSLALCIKHSFEKMPANLGFMLSEIPKWFSNSILRREAYIKLFEAFNGNIESSTLPLPFQKFCQTRWLVRGKVIYNILLNWEELKLYFSLAEAEGEASVRYKARMIADMLKDPVNHLYFHFLSPVVSEFERVNAFFQATDIDPQEMVKELNLYYRSLRSRVYDASGIPLPSDRVDFGAKFIFEAAALTRRHNNDGDITRRVHDTFGRCHSMLLEAAEQLSKRIPSSKEIFQSLSYLHPSRVLNQVGRVPLPQLPMQHLIEGKIHEIDNQYRSILHVDWNADTAVFDKGIPTDAVSFWSGVVEYRNLLGNSPFADLATYALACLTTPTSNAVVERIFSYVTSVKTKPRNRMSPCMLEAIVRIRTHLYFRDECCKDFVPSPRMLALFDSNNMYKATSLPSTDDDFDDFDF